MTEPTSPTGLPQFPEQSQAVPALVTGILGVLGCFVLCPVAWYLGNKELAGISQGRRDPANRGSATAAKVLGIVGTIIGVIVLIFFVIAPLIFFVSGSEVSETFSEIGSTLDG